MATVAVLGIGLLGEGFALNLIEKGHTVRVWNRTAGKCAAIEAAGGSVCSSPADAVSGVDRVHLVLSEDPVVDAVITSLRPGLSKSTVIIDHSTNQPAKVGARVTALAAEGIRYVHAPVFMGPQHSRTATGMMLLSGDNDDLRPALEAMTGNLMDLGDDVTRAATVKIAGNGLLMQLMAGVSDLFRIADAGNMPRRDLIEFLKAFNPGAAAMGKRILDSEPGKVSFALTMARKDTRLMIEAAGDGLITLPAIADAMDAAIAGGLGSEDFTAFVR